MPESNDHKTLQPMIPVPARKLVFDLRGISIGQSEYAEGPTGCTAFIFEGGWQTSFDKRGGMVGATGDYEFMHGLCFAGGSLLGLEAASGVGAELFARGGHSTSAMPLVNGAIIWDYVGRSNTIYPDKALGRAAAKAAAPGEVALGCHGAGRSATLGKMKFAPEPGGQGAAFREFAGVKILVVTVVNALGAVIDREGQIARGNLDPRTGERSRSIDVLAPGQRGDQEGPTQNTTLTLVATDAKLARRELDQFARQVHTSMARAIDPFHTATDGDTLYAATSNQVSLDPIRLTPDVLGMVAGEVAWDAVLSVVR